MASRAVLTAADPRPWCEEKAAELLGPGAKRKRVSRLTDTFIGYAERLKDRPGSGIPEVAALFFYPDFNSCRGSAEVFVLGGSAPGGPLTPARARELAMPDKNTLGNVEMTETEVPAGPAIRVRRSYALWGNVTRGMSPRRSPGTSGQLAPRPPSS